MRSASLANLIPASLGTPDDPPLNRRAHGSSRAHSTRSSFEVDRDRVIHSETFRDLQHKTQVQGLVGMSSFGRFRTRLNHAIEVAQIAGAAADRLGGNRALTEAIALAHDLGHPPFGHAGERALAEALREHGIATWNANLHSLAVVDEIEAAFVDFRGLNLTWATREGIARHSTPFDEPQSVGEFVRDGQSGLECQIVDAADVLAYLSHDLDDALADDFITLSQLADLTPRLASLIEDGEARWANRQYEWPEEEKPRLIRRYVVANFIARSIEDLIHTTLMSAEAAGVRQSDDVRSAPTRLVVHSLEFEEQMRLILQFLLDNYYRSEAVRDSDTFAEQAIGALFDWFFSRPDKIPARFRLRDLASDTAAYIASLNDRTAAALAQEIGVRVPQALA